VESLKNLPFWGFVEVALYLDVVICYVAESPVKPSAVSLSASAIETVDLTAESDDDCSSFASDDTATISCHSSLTAASKFIARHVDCCSRVCSASLMFGDHRHLSN